MDNLLDSAELLVTPMTLASLRAFGLQSLDFEPQILRDLYQERFGIKKLGQRLFDKLNCGYTLIGTDLYPKSLQVFLSCNGVMSGKPLDEDIITYNTLRDIVWGVWEYCNLTNEMEDSKPVQSFAPDIIGYIQEVSRLNGITKLPVWLSFAQRQTTGIDQVLTNPTDYEAYEQRQQGECNRLIKFVNEKQNVLVEQLNELQKTGVLP